MLISRQITQPVKITLLARECTQSCVYNGHAPVDYNITKTCATYIQNQKAEVSETGQDLPVKALMTTVGCRL